MEKNGTVRAFLIAFLCLVLAFVCDNLYISIVWTFMFIIWAFIAIQEILTPNK